MAAKPAHRRARRHGRRRGGLRTGRAPWRRGHHGNGREAAHAAGVRGAAVLRGARRGEGRAEGVEIPGLSWTGWGRRMLPDIASCVAEQL